MTRRRGVSLVELLVIMSATLIMLTICVGLIQSLVQVDRSTRNEISTRSGMARMAEVFRADVHAATRVEPAEGTHDRLVFHLPEGLAVEYRVETGRLVRVKTLGKEVKHQDAFRLPKHARAQLLIEPAANDMPAITAIVLTAKDPKITPWRNERIDAALGKDHRWQLAAEK